MRTIKTDKVKRKIRKKRDIIQTIALRKTGMSFREIGKIQGVTKDTVAIDLAKLNALLPDNTIINQLDKVKVDLFKGTLLKIVEGLNAPGKIKEASLNNAAYAFTQLHNAIRLEEGRTTSNVGYVDALRALKEAKEELRKLNDSNDPVVDVEPEPANDNEYIIPVVAHS